MKLAILSDIHANAYALKAVLDEIDSLNIEKIIICGDFVGYYYQAQEIFSLLHGRDIIACRGNHEDLLKAWGEGSPSEKAFLSRKYGSGFEMAWNSLSYDQKNFLFSLDHPVYKEFNDFKFCISHGAPWSIDCYVYFDKLSVVKEHFSQEEKVDVIIMGHTHYQNYIEMDGILLLNPGSVGQPRSGKYQETLQDLFARAQWAVIETEDLSVELKTTLYDVSDLFCAIKEHDSKLSYLSDVLKRRDI